MEGAAEVAAEVPAVVNVAEVEDAAEVEEASLTTTRRGCKNK